MKRLLENYTFNPITKQIILVDNENITQEKLLLITNMTSGIIIYNFADSETKGEIQNNIITLNYDTNEMNATDKLQIWVEDSNSLLMIICSGLNTIKHAVSRFTFDGSNQLRMYGSVSASLAANQTLTTVSTANIGLGDMGKPATVIMASEQAYHTSIGKNLIRS